MSSEEPGKSSSEILNELFSTFNTTYKKGGGSSKKKAKKKKKRRSEDSDSDIESRLKKSRKSEQEVVKKGKKKKKREVTQSPSPKKKKGKPKSSDDSVPIGDGFVVLRKSKPATKELEDGEIVDTVSQKAKKSKHEKQGEVLRPSGSVKKLSASQAYKLDAEERLFLGYDEPKRRRSPSPPPPPPPQRKSRSSDHVSSSSRSHRERSRSRSRSPKPRMAPPRDTYKHSYMRFEKQREYESYENERSSRTYDLPSYYDYHAQRSRESYSSGRSGFGYVGKSYYYDDVENDKAERREEKRYGTSSWRHRNRSRSRSPLRRSYYHPDDIIDKSQLLEIARKNAKKLMRSGCLPSDIFSRDQILAIKAGGKSVDELTQYCKKLAKRDAAGDARSGSESDGEGGDFIHHPFQVKDKPLPTITMNIRNAVPLPVRTPQELAIESATRRTVFPVSSGTQHRFKELEWKPVEEDKKPEDPNATALVPLDSIPSSSNETPVPPAEDETEKPGELKAIEAPPPTGITVDPPSLPDVDISSVIALRLKAMRSLQENPLSGDAKKDLEEATKLMKNWADAKALEPKFLTPAELQSGPQAWAKRDQLRKTRALDSGMGMHLLQKMGWRPGEGLGKNKEGQLEPLALDVKTDKKGLTAAVEELMYGKSKGSSGTGPSMPVVYDLSGKHPVSALMELTAKRRWGAPEFELCFEHGPPHKRQFVYKVIVNGVEYQPCVAVGNKKQAKANAAAFCLQSLGLLPTGAPASPSDMLQTVPPEPPASPTTPLAGKFTSPTLLQTVPTPQPVPPPLPIVSQDPSVLMPPPPPPPLLLAPK